MYRQIYPWEMLGEIQEPDAEHLVESVKDREGREEMISIAS